tara:strand:- start:9638 stop:10150 length:513 start_codon:yes stop_codon:yes gene_type:complete
MLKGDAAYSLADLTYTIQEFAQRYRAAHPGEYDHIPDDEIVRRYLALVPSYQKNIEDIERLYPGASTAPTQYSVYDEDDVAGFFKRMGLGFKSMFYNLGPGLGGTVLSVTDAPWAVSTVENWRKWARDKNLGMVRNNLDIQAYVEWGKDERNRLGREYRLRIRWDDEDFE